MSRQVLPPMNIDLERSILAGMLQGSPSVFEQLQRSGLRADDFYTPTHQTIAGICLDLYAEGTTDAWEMVSNKLPKANRAENRDLIVQLVASPYPTLYERACKRLVAIANARRLLATFRDRAQEIIDAGLDDLDSCQMTGWLRDELDAPHWNRALGIMSGAEVIETAEEAYRSHQVAGTVKTPPTGHEEFDRQCRLAYGNLVAVAGLPGSGKTTLALEWMANQSRAGKRSLFLSFEEGAEEMWQRWLRRANADVGRNVWRNHPLDKLSGYLDARDDARNAAANISFWEPGRGQKLTKLGDLMSLIAFAKQSKSIDTVYVDNVTSIANMGLSYGKQFERISEATQRLKNIAKELGVVVVLLAHIQREAAKSATERPRLAQVFGSSSLEQVCDIGIIVDRPVKRDPDADPREVWVYCDKVRGPYNPRYKLLLDEESCTLSEAEPEVPTANGNGVEPNAYWGIGK